MNLIYQFRNAFNKFKFVKFNTLRYSALLTEGDEFRPQIFGEVNFKCSFLQIIYLSYNILNNLI